MNRHPVCAALALLFCAAVLPAAVACTGQCVTKEYRKDEDYDATDVVYERDDHGYWIAVFSVNYYVPAQPGSTEIRGGGTPAPAETRAYQAMRDEARTAAALGRSRVNQRWEEVTRDAGTSNTCSTGCDCAEGSFTETPDSLWSGSAGIRVRTIEVNGRSASYFAMWIGAATIEFTRRVKTVGCIALEP